MNPVSSGIKACSPAGIVLSLPLLVSLLHLSSCLDLSGGGGVQLLSHVRLFVTPWTAVHRAPLSSNVFWILLRLMSTESWSYWTLILCCFILLLPSVFPSIRVFSKVCTSHDVTKVLELQFSNSPFSEHSGLISFRIDWLGLLAVQGTLKSLLYHLLSGGRRLI